MTENKEEAAPKVVTIKGEPVDEGQKSFELQAIEDCEEALSRAKGEPLTTVIVVGRTSDGRLFIDNSKDMVSTFVHLLSLAKMKIMGF